MHVHAASPSNTQCVPGTGQSPPKQAGAVALPHGTRIVLVVVLLVEVVVVDANAQTQSEPSSMHVPKLQKPAHIPPPMLPHGMKLVVDVLLDTGDAVVVVLDAGTLSVVVVLRVVVVLVVGGIVVEELRSSGHAPGAGAFFRLRAVASFFVSSPPKTAQYRFESVPTVSTMPWPRNGVGRLTPLPLHTDFTTAAFTSTTRQGSDGEPAPVYL